MWPNCNLIIHSPLDYWLSTFCCYKQFCRILICFLTHIRVFLSIYLEVAWGLRLFKFIPIFSLAIFILLCSQPTEFYISTIILKFQDILVIHFRNILFSIYGFNIFSNLPRDGNYTTLKSSFCLFAFLSLFPWVLGLWFVKFDASLS